VICADLDRAQGSAKAEGHDGAAEYATVFGIAACANDELIRASAHAHQGRAWFAALDMDTGSRCQSGCGVLAKDGANHRSRDGRLVCA